MSIEFQDFSLAGRGVAKWSEELKLSILNYLLTYPQLTRSFMGSKLIQGVEHQKRVLESLKCDEFLNEPVGEDEGKWIPYNKFINGKIVKCFSYKYHGLMASIDEEGKFEFWKINNNDEEAINYEDLEEITNMQQNPEFINSLVSKLKEEQ